MVQYKSPLHETVSVYRTDLWNDSCAIDELTYAVSHGATGATTNPTIVLEVLRKERQHWAPRIRDIATARPTASEVEVTWQLIEEMAVRGAGILAPIFEGSEQRKGRLSIQTDPTLHRNAAALTEQALRFCSLAPNMQVKIPATQAGIAAIEAVTRQGVNINATVCFSVPQALAVAEAVERGLQARVADGHSIEKMTPVCTIMVGRLDDWLKVVHERDGLTLTPGYMDWAGIAAIKRAAEIYRARGYRTRLLAAAYRHHMHWSELIGGDLILTITHAWQARLNASNIPVLPRFDHPVAAEIIEQLSATFDDFRRAYEPNAMGVDEFDTFGPTVRTLRGFIASYHGLLGVVRDEMQPNPDLKPAAAQPRPLPTARDQLIRPPSCRGFPTGHTPLTTAEDDVGFDFGILKLDRGQEIGIPDHREGALLLMHGEVELRCGDAQWTVSRHGLFDADPIALHFPARSNVAVRGLSEMAELALIQTDNAQQFEPQLFDRESMLEPSEHRGKGLLDGASHRIVRTLFDKRNRPSANLVLGEVVTFPGRWSSYPPHHHRQPEVYHYRFTDPRGFGHGELGEDVLRIHHGDTVRILDGQDHAQVAAPGYGMYYIWAIRHLPDDPYTVPEFAQDHRWLNDPNAKIWTPSTGEGGT